MKESQKWTVLEDDEVIHVVPITDIHPHGFPNDGMSAVLEDLGCPCKPKMQADGRKLLIIHNSFEDKKIIKDALEKLCLRCGIDRSFIKKEKVTCSVWGKSYKKHMYK